MGTIRTFVAIPLPREVREAAGAFAGLVRPFCADAKWERTDKMHLTVKFLGDTDERLIPLVIDALREAAAAVTPFDLTVAGFGAFPSMRRPRVLWIGCSDESGSLGLLHGGIEERLERLGVGRDDRPFHPHLTIARLRDDGAPSHLTSLPKYINFDARHTPVADLVLMRSELKPSGSEYTVIGAVKLT